MGIDVLRDDEVCIFIVIMVVDNDNEVIHYIIQEGIYENSVMEMNVRINYKDMNIHIKNALLLVIL